MPNSRPAPGAGRARAWNATTLCAPASWAASNAAGRPSRSPAGSAGKRPPPPSAMKASTASSTPRSGAPRTAPGAATCPEPSSNAGGAAAEAAPPPASSRTGSPLPSALPPPDTAVARDIGRPTSCSSPPTDRPSSSPSKAAQPTVEQLLAWLRPLDDKLRQTITFDNGTEFAQHYKLTRQLGIRTFFCDTHSPWQKGGVENAIGRLRRPLPRKTDLATLDRDTLNACVAAYNNTPRKCPGYKSPAQAFFAQLLHFKCESTFPLSRE